MRRILATLVLALVCAPVCRGALSFTVEANGWPSAAHRQAAVDAMQSSVNRYNAFGDFGNANIYVKYEAGVQTADANYLGQIRFGGTYPNERVSMHEISHYLGTGTYGTPWDGNRGEAIVDQFDGLDATLQGDSQHYWPYGLNYDSEGAEINKQRQVALLYAMRADMGIGSTTIPGAAVVNLTASDPIGESGFNYASRWSDTHFAHAGAAYSTGNFTLRTPASGSSFTFVGESVTVNNTNGINGGLLYKGTGATGVTTFKNLNLDGGYVRHASSTGDLFQLGGKVTLSQTATFDAAQGPIKVLAPIGGSGSLVKSGAYAMTLNGAGAYAGNTTISGGTLRLGAIAPVANYTFDNGSGPSVINNGTGGTIMNGTLAGGATIVPGGRYGNAVSLSGGASVNINNPVVDLGNSSNWTVSAWVKTTTPGSTILSKGDGVGWGLGNTVLYLGDGTAGGSGGIPSGVRYAGGFYQGATNATAVNNNAWRQVTYVNSGGTYSIYVDGVAQPLSAGNSGFGNSDIGAVVRLGATTNTFAGDGTVNFNGLMDSVQFYNQALSGAQIEALYNGNAAIQGSLPKTTNLTIANGATLSMSGLEQEVASLAGSAGALVEIGSGRLIVNSTTNSQFNGQITGIGGTLVKKGPGKLTLGATNSPSETQVNGGVLQVNWILNSTVLVNSGGTLQGTGDIESGVSVASGGIVAPGDGAGILYTRGLDLASGAETIMEIGGTTPGSQYDSLDVAGYTTFGGALTVSLINGFAPAAGDSFNLFDVMDWNQTTGSFASMTLPTLASGLAWNTTNLYSSGVLAVSAVPEPASLWLFGFAVVVVARRRSRSSKPCRGVLPHAHAGPWAWHPSSCALIDRAAG